MCLEQKRAMWRAGGNDGGALGDVRAARFDTSLCGGARCNPEICRCGGVGAVGPHQPQLAVGWRGSRLKSRFDMDLFFAPEEFSAVW